MKTIIYERNVIDFLKELHQEEKSEATMDKYERDIRKFVRFLNGQTISKDLVIRYKQELMRKYASVSVNSMLIPVNRFLRFMNLHSCTVKTLKIQRASFRSKDKEITREEYVRLVKVAERSGDVRISLILQTIAATGIRVSELPFITVEALRDGIAHVTLKGKHREVLIPKQLRKKLKNYVGKRKLSTGSVFITRNGKPVHRGNVLKAMKRLCDMAHVEAKKVFPHNFRHLFACQFYKATKDIVRLADILGHSSINTTRIYTVVSMEEQGKQIHRLGLIL